ncbi:AIPR family protein [Parvimonas micra]|uniref:AIPR family protein n=1 Tax=Parvimonas micra TaxID=33033 RepID=UPI00248DDEC2|nr:AIPR family protein [Parvimonas micra]
MDNFEKIKGLAKKAGVSEGKLSQEFLFTVQMVDYFYFKNNIGEQDIREDFVDGSSDGGIDFIFNLDDTMYLVQGKSSQNLIMDDISNIFTKMDSTVKDFDKGKYHRYSEKLKSAYLNAYDDLSENKNITLVLFTNTVFNDNMREKIENFKKIGSFNDYNIEVYGADEIEFKISSSEFEKEYIDKDFLDLSETRNALKYGENGIIVNIKASSLKKLYTKHSKNGLFSYNLREHISQKNVDNGIENTIRSDRKNFWYYNNGITIGCEEFTLDGNILKLYKFSIINGAQTTTKIGQSKLIDKEQDFDLVCKVVKASSTLDNESDFIMKISEASNSQKPIKARDLKANSREQKLLQQKSASNKNALAIEIKRGVKPKNYNKVEKWARVTNEYIGQLILACLLQKPGSARSGKITIFTSEKLYNQIYRRKHDYDILYDLVRIGDKYDDFKAKFTEDTDDVNRIAACKNGKLETLAVIFYFYKIFNNIIDNSSDKKLNEDNITDTQLTLNYKGDDYDKILYSLFKFIINRFTDIYEKKKESFKFTSYSNFFKTDSIYKDVILNDFDRALNDDWDREKLKEYMKIFDYNEERY